MRLQITNACAIVLFGFAIKHIGGSTFHFRSMLTRNQKHTCSKFLQKYGEKNIIYCNRLLVIVHVSIDMASFVIA